MTEQTQSPITRPRRGSDNVAATMQSLWDQFGFLVDALNEIDTLSDDEVKALEFAKEYRSLHVLKPINKIASKASLDSPIMKDLRKRLESYGVKI